MIDFKEITFDLDPAFFDRAIKAKAERALDNVASMAFQHGHELANQKLGSSLKLWEDGYKAHKVSSDLWVISMTGELSNMFEQGFQQGKIRDMLLKGPVASAKGYVDVPMSDKTSKNVSKVSIQASTSLDQIVKNMSGKERRSFKTIQKQLKVQRENKSKSSYVTFRRVSANTPTSTWPSNPFDGAKVFDDLEIFVKEKFPEELARLF
jgi:hypothetical protein